MNDGAPANPSGNLIRFSSSTPTALPVRGNHTSHATRVIHAHVDKGLRIIRPRSCARRPPHPSDDLGPIFFPTYRRSSPQTLRPRDQAPEGHGTRQAENSRPRPFVLIDEELAQRGRPLDERTGNAPPRASRTTFRERLK